MKLHILDDSLWFPPVVKALKDGLLAVGGDLSRERLLLAYNNGIFPWFNEGEIPLWWSPDPRFVLFPSDLKVSKSMKTLINKGKFEFRTNTAFEEVIHNCRSITRDGQDGTWITQEIATAYIDLHNAGYAHSAETWQEGKLVGGIYGIKLGRIFFGESMFSKVSNASKFAFILWVKQLIMEDILLIDCQVHTKHLESLGAGMISRSAFLNHLKTGIPNNI